MPGRGPNFSSSPSSSARSFSVASAAAASSALPAGGRRGQRQLGDLAPSPFRARRRASSDSWRRRVYPGAPSRRPPQLPDRAGVRKTGRESPGPARQRFRRTGRAAARETCGRQTRERDSEDETNREVALRAGLEQVVHAEARVVGVRAVRRGGRSARCSRSRCGGRCRSDRSPTTARAAPAPRLRKLNVCRDVFWLKAFSRFSSKRSRFVPCELQLVRHEQVGAREHGPCGPCRRGR